MTGAGSPRRSAKCWANRVGVDGRGGDDQLEVGPARQQPLEVAEQEVDVEAALVGLVDDDRVVLAQVAVALQLGEQDAVGHQLDAAGPRGLVGEPHLVADLVAQLGAQLRRDPLGHRPRRDPAGLGVPDDPVLAALAAAQLQADLRQLGGLARACLARDDDDLVVTDGGGDVVAALRDRQLRREGDVHGADHGARPDHACAERDSPQRHLAAAANLGQAQVHAGSAVGHVAARGPRTGRRRCDVPSEHVAPLPATGQPVVERKQAAAGVETEPDAVSRRRGRQP